MHYFKSVPSDRAWNRLNDKLQLRRNKRSASWYRWVAVAATSIAVLSVLAIYQLEIHDHNPQLFAYNSDHTDARPSIIEELELANEDGIYSVEKLQNLNQAYIKLLK